MLRPFDVLFPASVQEASAELARLGDEAVVYSGGVELVLLTRLGFTEAGTFVDVKRIPGMGDLAAENGHVRIGATVTHRRAHTDALVRERLPLLAQAASRIGNVRIRNQGTLGGEHLVRRPAIRPARAVARVRRDGHDRVVARSS